MLAGALARQSVRRGTPGRGPPRRVSSTTTSAGDPQPAPARRPRGRSAGRPAASRGPRRRARSSVQESAVDTSALLADQLVRPAAPRRVDPPRRTRAFSQACMARSRRWVETRTAAPRARASAITSRVASTPSGSTPSKGSSSSSTDGSWKVASTDREPAAHAVAEAGGHPVGDVAELEALEQVLRPLLPVARAGAAGRRAGGAPRGSPAAPGRRRRGSSRSAA